MKKEYEELLKEIIGLERYRVENNFKTIYIYDWNFIYNRAKFLQNKLLNK